MKVLSISSIRTGEELFHTTPQKLPPRHDLRKMRVLDDPDLKNDDPDLELSCKDSDVVDTL